MKRTMTITTRSYAAVRRLKTFEERYAYLQLKGQVGRNTFGYDRYLNQNFYRSSEWKRIRRDVIVRDNGCDLGIEGREIRDRILIHHMNPMTVEDVIHSEAYILDPQYLITTSHSTHNAIHYGDDTLLQVQYNPRRPGDTTLWSSMNRR